MFFVLLSHFGFTYFPQQRELVPTAMRLIGMVASPTFIIINGMLIGFLHRTRGNEFNRLRAMLVDRGIFLLTIGHLLILGSHLTYTLRFLSITDTVGVCVLVGPYLVTRLRPRERLVLSVSTFVLSWVVIESWQPHNVLSAVVKETIFGSLTPSVYYYLFPVLPWLGLDLAASVLGEKLGALRLNDDTGGMQRLLLGTGGASLCAAAILNAVGHAIRYYGAPNTLMVQVLASPFQKEPPSLVYLLTYGGLGLGVISSCLWLTRRGHPSGFVARVATLGRNSFAVFVIQFYVYFTILPLILKHLPLAPAWGMYFPVSIVMVVLPAVVWHRRGYNKYLTVGYLQAWETRTSRRSEPALTRLTVARN